MPFFDRSKKFLPQLGKLLPGGGTTGDGSRLPIVAIFGKHPGWSDHITLPLPTPALRTLWQSIYSTGIRLIIERGIWSQISEAELIPFGHLFITGQRRQWIVGRMWASADKVGRRDYPMAACVDFDNSSSSQAIDAAVPILEKLEIVCRQATKSTDVLSGLETARVEAAAVVPANAPAETSAIQAIKSHPDLKDANQSLLGVLFCWSKLLHRGWGAKVFSRQMVRCTSPVRVPLCASNSLESLKLWTRFTTEIAGSKYPVFLAVSDAQPVVDILLGEPGPTELAVLRRSATSFESITDPGNQEYAKSFRRWASAKLN